MSKSWICIFKVSIYWIIQMGVKIESFQVISVCGYCQEHDKKHKLNCSGTENIQRGKINSAIFISHFPFFSIIFPSSTFVGFGEI